MGWRERQALAHRRGAATRVRFLLRYTSLPAYATAFGVPLRCAPYLARLSTCAIRLTILSIARTAMPRLSPQYFRWQYEHERVTHICSSAYRTGRANG